ncbi:tautomerase family protein [Geothrix sp. PMB-07]|uniref:tautomerase family protein n=1 Tax=Geothrix sp. PMB-07 TaxID=3068640 RepID=UPI002740B7D9|nr:tautomerase family protein [Geothrix sp. PMB-07]WLT32609.1 tautomerase family protein [Geothrix sp. PMB-07]
MPLVRISHRSGLSEAYRQALSDGVQEAMASTVNVPADDRFHILTEHASGLVFDAHYLGIERSPEWVAIQITLRKGRTVEMKQALYRRIVENLAAKPGVRPEDVLICLVENDLPDWSFGNGVAQYVR